MIDIHVSDPNKVMILVRGLPGSGRTTAARTIQNTVYKGAGVILATDDFFIDEQNRYCFDPTKLQVAHAWNRGRCRDAMQAKTSPILIDNVFSQAWEAKSYYEIAMLYGYSIKVTASMTTWRRNPGMCANKTLKGVGADAIHKVLRRWEEDFSMKNVMQQSVPAERSFGYKHPKGDMLKAKHSAKIPQQSKTTPVDEESTYKKNKISELYS